MRISNQVIFAMDLDPRQTALVQIPVGKGLAPWMDGGQQACTDNQDESALRGTSPTGDTQVDHPDKSKDGNLSELNRLMELSAGSRFGAIGANNSVSAPSTVRRVAVGISGGTVAGVLACVLAMHFIRNTTANQLREPTQLEQVAAEEVRADDAKPTASLEQKSGAESLPQSAGVLEPEAQRDLPAESIPDPRLKARLATEVLFDLDLSLDQAARIRTILERCSKDLPFAETQIRGLLTEDQNRRWEEIAP